MIFIIMFVILAAIVLSTGIYLLLFDQRKNRITKESDVLAKKIKFRCPICHAEFVVPRDEASIHIDNGVLFVSANCPVCNKKKLSKKLTQKVTHCKNVCYICAVDTKSKLKNAVNKL